MNKTTTRLAVTGAVIVLGAFALVLAQNDAGNRDREQPSIEPFAAQVAVPIPVDDQDNSWGSSPSPLPTSEMPPKDLLVRANNDQLTRYGEDRKETPGMADEPLNDQSGPTNPLRGAAEELLDQSQVVLAGAGIPVEPPAGGRPSTSAPTGPSYDAGVAKPADLAPRTAVPADLEPPKLPTFPMNTGFAGSAVAPGTLNATTAAPTNDSPMPAAVATLPTLPTAFPSGGNNLSGSDVGSPFSAPRGDVPPTSQVPSSLPSSTANPLPNPGFSNSVSPTSNVYVPPTANTLDKPQNLPSATGPIGGQYLGNSAEPARDLGQSSSSPAAERQPVRTAALTGLVSNQPGNRYLDGSQNPNMLIQKRAPEEIQVGKKATFVIAVRNAGNATAHDVRVVDSVPQGVRFVESAPPATPNTQGILTWDLGEMSAGDEKTITLQIVPEVQGEVGSNALVYFAAQASVRTVATLPKLELQLQSQPDMMISSRQQISVLVKNTGTGVARGVRLEADLPNLLKHDSGESQLAASLGDMRPNDTLPITLDVSAVAAGQSQIVIRAVTDDGAMAEEQVGLQVLAPNLAAQIEGPKLRYLERQATYQIKVKNTGTAVATNLDFVVHLPAGLKYNSANNRGTYDPAQHTVSWGLYELPAGEIAPIELTVLPVELGPQAISFAATGDLGIKAEAKGTVTVDGLAELSYTIGQDNGTIETGASSTYSVQITNVGNKADKDVRLAVQLPSGSQLLNVDAQVNYHTEGNQILFDPVPEMRNKDQYTFRFQVQHNQPGTQVVRTQLTSANWPVAVIKEEGTLVYNDQN